MPATDHITITVLQKNNYIYLCKINKPMAVGWGTAGTGFALMTSLEVTHEGRTAKVQLLVLNLAKP